ncbi:MAG: tetratricopeptide repeat protein [Pelosinus sp.]|nr:tetratricopeptide repeat protein [Pelosinus sp.]
MLINKANKFCLIILFCLMLYPFSAIYAQTSQELLYEGIGYDQKHNYDKALECYSKAIEIDPNFAGPYNLRGNIYAQKGFFELALADYSMFIKLEPNNSGGYHNRGNLYSSYKQYYNLAISDYSRAIQLGDSCFTRRARGIVYIETHQYYLALEDFKRMTELNDEEGYCYKSQVYGLIGDYQSAINECEGLLEKYQDHPIALFNLGQAYDLLGENDEAIQYYQRLNGRTFRDAKIMNKVNARLLGDWDSYKEWVY